MKTKTSPKFKKGDMVTWTSQASGYAKKKTGKVKEVVPAGEYATNWLATRNDGEGKPRNHRSYVVSVDGVLYHPRVKWLKAVKGSAK